MGIEIGYLFQSAGRSNYRVGPMQYRLLDIQHYEHQIEVCITGSQKRTQEVICQKLQHCGANTSDLPTGRWQWGCISDTS